MRSKDEFYLLCISMNFAGQEYNNMEVLCEYSCGEITKEEFQRQTWLEAMVAPHGYHRVWP